MTHSENKTSKPGFLHTAGITVLFFLFGFAGILHHEMWLDEIHHWLIARESTSLSDLYVNMRIEGHPLLWNIILFGINRFTDNPVFMQLIHILIATLAAGIFFYYAPFSILFKTGILASYFFFYEYNIISRNYAPGLLFLWILCILLSQQKINIVLTCLVAGLLANTHLFYLIISSGLMSILLFTTYKNKNKTALFAGFFIYSALVCMSLRCIIPADIHLSTAYNHEAFFTFKRIEKVLSAFIKAFLSVPDFLRINSWNTNLITEKFHLLSLIPSALCLFMPFFMFSRNKLCLFFFYFCSFCICGFLYFSTYSIGARYYGVIYVVFILTHWLHVIFKDQYRINYSDRFNDLLFRINKLLIRPFYILLFGTQILASVIMYTKDYLQPFSQAQKTVQFLAETGFDKKNIAVTNCAAISTVRGFIPLNVYSPESDTYEKYCHWTIQPFQCKETDLINKMKRVMLTTPSDWIIVANHELLFNTKKSETRIDFRDNEIKIQLVKSFTGSLVNSENYFVYKVTN